MCIPSTSNCNDFSYTYDETLLYDDNACILLGDCTDLILEKP